MIDKDINSEVLNELFKNSQMAITSIDYLIKSVDDETFKNQLLSEYEIYQDFSSRISTLLLNYGRESKEPNIISKAMLFSGIKMNTLKDDSKSHLAEMMVTGTVMGVTDLLALKTKYESALEEDVLAILNELLEKEESFEEELKTYL